MSTTMQSEEGHKYLTEHAEMTTLLMTLITLQEKMPNWCKEKIMDLFLAISEAKTNCLASLQLNWISKVWDHKWFYFAFFIIEMYFVITNYISSIIVEVNKKLTKL